MKTVMIDGKEYEVVSIGNLIGEDDSNKPEPEVFVDGGSMSMDELMQAIFGEEDDQTEDGDDYREDMTVESETLVDEFFNGLPEDHEFEPIFAIFEEMAIEIYDNLGNSANLSTVLENLMKTRDATIAAFTLQGLEG